jgi:hypothetical protein
MLVGDGIPTFPIFILSTPLPERIANQKFAVQSLVVLYRYSVDDPGRTGDATPDNDKAGNLMSRRMLKKALHGVKAVASSTTNIFGDVASEIMGRYAKSSSLIEPSLKSFTALFFSHIHQRQWLRLRWNRQISHVWYARDHITVEMNTDGLDKSSAVACLNHSSNLAPGPWSLMIL